MNDFTITLNKGDKVAAESTDNSNYFYQNIGKHVANITVVNPSQLNVIRSSVKKTDKNDARSLFFLFKQGYASRVAF